MKKMYVVLSLLAAVSIVLAACTTASPASSSGPLPAAGGNVVLSNYKGITVHQTTITNGAGFNETYNGMQLHWNMVSDNTAEGGAVTYQMDGYDIFLRKVGDANKFARQRNALTIEESVQGWSPNTAFAYDEAQQFIYSKNLGRPLLDIVKEEGGWSSKTIGWYNQAETLVVKMHGAGVELQDVGPANVLVDQTTGAVGLNDVEFNAFPGEVQFVQDEVEAAILTRRAFSNGYYYQSHFADIAVQNTYEEALASAGLQDSVSIESFLTKVKAAPVSVPVAANSDMLVVETETGAKYEFQVAKNTPITIETIAAELASAGIQIPVFWIRATQYFTLTASAAVIIVVIWDVSNWAYKNAGFTGLLAPKNDDESWSHWPGNDAVIDTLARNGYENWIPFRVYHGPTMAQIHRLMELSVQFAVSDPTMNRVLKDDSYPDILINAAAFHNVDTGIKISPFQVNGGSGLWPWAPSGLRFYDDQGQSVDVIYNAQTGQWSIASANRVINRQLVIPLKVTGGNMNCTITMTMKDSTDGTGPYEEYMTNCQ